MKIKNLAFQYDAAAPAFQDFNLSFAPEKLTTIIGPNGSGKSTLLKLLSGQLKPQQGEILINQQPLHSLKGKEIGRQLAYLPQRQKVPENLTVAEFVAFGRIPHQNFLMTATPRDEEVIQEALAQCHLTALKNQRVATLSGGQFQRAALALVLAQETPILLLDEPINALDIQHEYLFLQLLRKLQRQKKLTVIMVLHQLQLALEFSDYLVLLQEGKLVAVQDLQQEISLTALENIYQVPFAFAQHQGQQYLVVKEGKQFS